MKLRDYYLKREATISDSDTIIMDIDINDPISSISIEYEATNGATSCKDHELHDDVSKIEIVDGSDIICSLSMSQLRALNFYELGVMPHEKTSEVGGETQEEKAIIHFGRFPDDPSCYLDAKQFKNPQLRLTHSLSISATEGFATGTGKVTVIARVIEKGALEQIGFMMSKERYSFASAGSGDEEIDLYRDYPYNHILMQALLTTYTPQEIITKLKLTCDADKYIPFDMYMEDIEDYCRTTFGLARQEKGLYRANAEAALLDLYDIKNAHFSVVPALHVAQITGIDAEQLSIGLDVLAVTPTIALQTTEQTLGVMAKGLCPFATLALPIPRVMDPAGLFDPREFGAVKLIASQGTASAAVKVFSQQLRSPKV